MDDIKFTGDGLQGRGGKGDVLIATIPTRVSASGSVETVAVKQLRLSDGIGEEKFLRVFVNELRVVDGISNLDIVKIIGFVEDIEKRICWLVFRGRPTATSVNSFCPENESSLNECR